MLGKSLGKKGLLFGAVAQVLPDLDVIAALWLDPATNLLVHRGITHSLFFCLITLVLLAVLTRFVYPLNQVVFHNWLGFFALQLGGHLFLDLFNNYGVGLLEPFDHTRLSFHALYVVDPFFTTLPAIALIMLLILPVRRRVRKFWWRLGIGYAMLYLGYCVLNKWKVTTAVQESIAHQQLSYQSYFTTPAPLNSWLWYVVVKSDSGFYVGYRSVFDEEPRTNLNFFPTQDSLLRELPHSDEINLLKRFSQGYYTVEKWQDTLVFNDLRFGQITGWHDPGERFTFHYFLRPPGASNQYVVQRGRFANWNKQSVYSLFIKICGD